MGLDMYLDAKRSLYNKDWNECESDKIAYRQIREMFPEMHNSGNLNYISVSFEAGYWRKASAIHKWFVDNVQDGEDNCSTNWVDREQLEELRDTCKDVLAKHARKDELLPTADGFFFGGTDYDEWYFNSLEQTVDILDKCLALPEEWNFYYHSSW